MLFRNRHFDDKPVALEILGLSVATAGTIPFPF